MAYVIPVAALILEPTAAAHVAGEPEDFFVNSRNNRWDAVERLAQITGAPIQSFSDEEGDIFYIGIQLDSDWCIDINGSLITKAAAFKSKYTHPLVQSAQLAVVSQFC